MKKQSTKTYSILSVFKLSLPMIISAISLAFVANAQQPFQDAKGEGSLFVRSGGFVQVNVSDPSIRFSYLRDVSDNKWTYGFDLSGKPSGTTASLINNGNLVPEAKFNFTIGIKNLATRNFDARNIIVTKDVVKELEKELKKSGLLIANKTLPNPGRDVALVDYLDSLTSVCLITPANCVLVGTLTPATATTAMSFSANTTPIFQTSRLKDFRQFDRLVFQGGYAYKEYSLYNASLPFDQQVYKKKFQSPKAQLIYTRMIKGNTQLGATVGVEKSNNSDELTEIEVRDFTTVTSGTTIREAGRTKKALRGDFTQTTRAFINTDYVVFPKKLDSRIGLNFFTRSGLTGSSKGFKPGVGLFISEKGSPTNVIGGISVLLDKGKPRLALTAGFNF